MTDAVSAFDRRIVSVLFADLVGFTPLAERMDAEDVAAIQDRYFAAVRETIGRYGGVLEKFIGDAAMAVFGTPVTRDDDAERAVRAGLAIVGAVDRLGVQLGLEPGELVVRVGIDTGEVVHAVSGPDAGRVTGDTVNTAARLQAASAPGRVLLGSTTTMAVADAVETEPLQPYVLKGKAEPVPAAFAVAPRPVRSRELAMGSLRAPLIGREDDLALLRGDLDRAVVGRTTVRRLIVAPPGTGKSRLIDAFAGGLEPAIAVTVVRFRPDDARPFGALADLVPLGPLDGLPPPADERAAVAVAALRVLAGAETGAADDRDGRFAAWLDGFQLLARDRTSVWILEDLHWASDDVLAFLDAALGSPATGGRLILATARPALADRAPGWCAARDGASRLDLGTLAPADARRLVGALAGDALPPSLTDRIVAASDGNCLFIEELLRTWAAVGVLRRDGDRWQLAASAGSVEIPATVQALYAAQLDDLSPDARRFARRAAVAGREVPTGAFEPLGIAGDDGSLGTLRRRDILAGPVGDGAAAGYRYRHALLRDAGYAGLAHAERAVLHVRLASWLEGDQATRERHAETIAAHYAAAVDTAPRLALEVAPGLSRDAATHAAATWFETAGAGALAAGAQAAAAAHFTRAAERTAADAALDRARRRRLAGTATALGGDMDAAAVLLEGAIEDARAALPAAEARESLARAGAALSRVRAEQLRFDEARRLALEIRVEAAPCSTVADAWLGLRVALAADLATGEPALLREAALAAERVGADAGDRDLELDGLAALAFLGDEDGRMAAVAGRLIERAEPAGRWDLVVRGLRLQAFGAGVDGADPHLDEAERVATVRHLDEALAWIHQQRAATRFERGELHDALDAARAALTIALPRAYHRAAVRAWFIAVPVAAALGERAVLADAAAWFAAARAGMPRTPYGLLSQAAVDVRLAAAGLLAPPPLDRAELIPGLADASDDAGWLDSAGTVIAGWIDRGWLDAADHGIGAVARGLAEPSPIATATLAILRGRLALAHGEVATAGEAARAAIAALGERGPWWALAALELLAAADAAGPADRIALDRCRVRLGLAPVA